MSGPSHASAMEQATSYLRTQFAGDSPETLVFEAEFPGSPMEGEGTIVLFSFRANPDGTEVRRFWVAAGETEPNYYPDWHLDAEDLYRVHLGTRFMLVMQVSTVPEAEWPGDMLTWFETFVASISGGVPPGELHLRNAFRLEDSICGVAEVVESSGNDDDVPGRWWLVGYQAPPGVYRYQDIPPHVVLRRHFGHVILQEAHQEERDRRRT